MWKTFLYAILVGTICLGPFSASDAMQAFVQVSGIQGQSVDKNHLGWSDLMSFTWGHTNGSFLSTTTKAQFNALTIEKFVDSASLGIASAGTTVQHFPEVKLEIWTAIADASRLLGAVWLKDVIVTSYAVQVPQGQALSTLARPIEKVTFLFKQIEWYAWAYDPVSGTVRLKPRAGFDLSTNKAF